MPTNHKARWLSKVTKQRGRTKRWWTNPRWRRPWTISEMFVTTKMRMWMICLERGGERKTENSSVTFAQRLIFRILLFIHISRTSTLKDPMEIRQLSLMLEEGVEDPRSRLQEVFLLSQESADQLNQTAKTFSSHWRNKVALYSQTSVLSKFTASSTSKRQPRMNLERKMKKRAKVVLSRRRSSSNLMASTRTFRLWPRSSQAARKSMSSSMMQTGRSSRRKEAGSQSLTTYRKSLTSRGRRSSCRSSKSFSKTMMMSF